MRLWLAYALDGGIEAGDAVEVRDLDRRFAALCSRERADGAESYGGRGGAWVTPRALAALLPDLRSLPARLSAAPDRETAERGVASAGAGRLDLPGFGSLPLPMGKGEAAAPLPPEPEASQHSSAEAARATADVEWPPEAERTRAASLASRFRSLADQAEGEKAVARRSEAVLGAARRRVAQALAAIRLAAPDLEQLRAQAPKIYEAVGALADSVAVLARAVPWAPLTRAEQAAADVAAASAPQKGRRAAARRPEMPVGTAVEGTGRFKVRHMDGTTGWRQARSGMILSRDPAQHAASALRPGAK